MTWLIPLGAVVTLIGLTLLIATVIRVIRVKKGGDADALHKILQSAVAWNMGAMGISAIGLMMVVMGMLL